MHRSHNGDRYPVGKLPVETMKLIKSPVVRKTIKKKAKKKTRNSRIEE